MWTSFKNFYQPWWKKSISIQLNNCNSEKALNLYLYSSHHFIKKNDEEIVYPEEKINTEDQIFEFSEAGLLIISWSIEGWIKQAQKSKNFTEGF